MKHRFLACVLTFALVLSMMPAAVFAAAGENTVDKTNAKFALEVSSELKDGSVTTVLGTVDENYRAELTIPNAKVDANNVKVGVYMNNVESLGIEHASHEINLKTELTQTPALIDWLQALYDFEDATINASITDDEGSSANVTYNMAGSPFDADSAEKTVVAAPDSVESARAAWQAMVNDKNFDISKQEADDSYIVIANGSTLQLGDEKLVFTEGVTDDLTIAKSGQAISVADIQKAVELKTGLAEEEYSFHLAAGTTLAVGQSVAALKKDVDVTVEGLELRGGYLSDLRSAIQNPNSDTLYSILATGFIALQEAIAEVDRAAEVNVAINFTTPEEPEEPVVPADNSKFKVVVSSKLGDTATEVVGKVDEHYNAELTLPNAKVNAGNVKVDVYMNDVASLGGGNRHHAIELNTGLTQTPELTDWFGSLYDFGTATVNATIKSDDTEKNVTYVLEGSAFNKESGEPKVITGKTNEADARAAWQLMVNEDNFSITTQSKDDSYALIKKDSYLQIGTEKLVFEDNASDLTLGKDGQMPNAGMIQDAVKLTTADSEAVEFFLAKGTTLAVGQSVAELAKDVKVTLDGFDKSKVDLNVLSTIREAINNDNDVLYTLLANTILFLNDAVAASDGQTLNVSIEFTTPEEPDQPVVPADNSKFKVVVSSKLGDATTEVVGKVDEHYNAELTLPNAKVNAGNVKVDVYMNDVASLGGGNRHHAIELNTGLTQTPELTDWFGSLYDFGTATVNATIKSDDTEKNVTYVLEGSAFNKESGEPKVITGKTNEADARAAWQLMVNEDNFSITTQSKDDSYALIKKDSYLQIGTEKLVFEDNASDLTLGKDGQMPNAGMIQDAVKLTTADSEAVEFFLAKGTTLAVGQSVAELAKDVKVTLDGFDKSKVDLNVLSTIREAINNDNDVLYTLLANTILFLNDAVAASDGQTLNVAIEFTTPVCKHVNKTVSEPVWAEDLSAATFAITCSDCGEDLGTETVDAAVETTVEPTCETTGTLTATVVYEGKTYTTTKVLDVTAHTVVEDVAAAATCETAGKTAGSHCSVCGTIIVAQEEIEALGHDHSVEVENSAVAATCETAGKEADMKCSRCDDVEEGAVIPALDHQLGAPVFVWTADANGVWVNVKVEQSCVREGCEHVVTTENVPITVETTPATYTAAGKTVYTATFGGVTETKEVEIPRLVRRGGGGGGSTVTPPVVEIEDPDVPLADLPVNFTDVKEGEWCYEAVKHVAGKGIMNGTSATTFEPNAVITRGMVVTILWNLENKPAAGENPFTDVKEGEWYADAVAWAAANDVVAGYGNNIFRPEQLVTREEFATILRNYSNFKKYDTTKQADLSKYADASKIEEYAVQPVSWANAHAMINGVSDTELAPASGCTRAQAASILSSFLKQFVESAEDKTPETTSGSAVNTSK